VDGTVEGATNMESLDNQYGYMWMATLERPISKDKYHVKNGFQKGVY